MRSPNLSFILLFFLVFIINGCTSVDSKFTATQDPYEKTNRQIFKFNQAFDKHLLKPVSESYQKNVPDSR